MILVLFSNQVNTWKAFKEEIWKPITFSWLSILFNVLFEMAANQCVPSASQVILIASLRTVAFEYLISVKHTCEALA